MNTYETVRKELPALRNSLENIASKYLLDARLIGSAIAYLVLLEDLLIEKSRKEQ